MELLRVMRGPWTHSAAPRHLAPLDNICALLWWQGLTSLDSDYTPHTSHLSCQPSNIQVRADTKIIQVIISPPIYREFQSSVPPLIVSPPPPLSHPWTEPLQVAGCCLMFDVVGLFLLPVLSNSALLRIVYIPSHRRHHHRHYQPHILPYNWGHKPCKWQLLSKLYFLFSWKVISPELV